MNYFKMKKNIKHENEMIPSEIFTQIYWDINDFVCETKINIGR